METNELKPNEQIIDGVLHYLDGNGQYVPYTAQALTIAVTALRAGYMTRVEQVAKLKAAMLEAMAALRSATP